MNYYSAFFAFFAAAFLGAAFFAAALASPFFPPEPAFFFFFFGRVTPVEPMWIFPLLDLLSPFPIIIRLVFCKSKKLSLQAKAFCLSKNTAISNSFHKSERLCSKKQMELLFKKGRSSNAYPVKLTMIETGEEMKFPAQVMFVVPKKSFKRSPDRNKLKRRMREVYRTNKSAMYQNLSRDNRKLLLAFIYTGKKMEGFGAIESSLLKLMAKL